MRVILFANGELQFPRRALEVIQEGDALIAADGGARHCLSLGLLPKLVIGDFDSLSERELDELKNAGVELRRHPAHKDETDLELALIEAQKYHPEEIIIFGALGARWDMTLANMLLLAHPDFCSSNIRIVDGPQELSSLRGGQTRQISGQPGDTVSLIPMMGDARGVNTHGLAYPLVDGTLRFGTSRGVSNEMLAPRAIVRLEEGNLFIVHIRQNDRGRVIEDQ
ncbi:MAG: thiamine diphosphokinase [Chloroflexi bacterium]|nr:thiamine diphosphokinase [Chloroflexota bacterium]